MNPDMLNLLGRIIDPNLHIKGVASNKLKSNVAGASFLVLNLSITSGGSQPLYILQPGTSLKPMCHLHAPTPSNHTL